VKKIIAILIIALNISAQDLKSFQSAHSKLWQQYQSAGSTADMRDTSSELLSFCQNELKKIAETKEMKKWRESYHKEVRKIEEDLAKKGGTLAGVELNIFKAEKIYKKIISTYSKK
jgi:hypothetical protein